MKYIFVLFICLFGCTERVLDCNDNPYAYSIEKLISDKRGNKNSFEVAHHTRQIRYLVDAWDENNGCGN